MHSEGGDNISEKEKIDLLDHHGLLPELVQSHGGLDSAPVELDRAADAVDTTSEHNYTVVVEGDIVGCSVVRSLAVVSICMPVAHTPSLLT
jgi:hypothetical protein